MACLLRLPGNGGPGVFSLTTWERDHVVRKQPAVAQQLARLKPRWLIGLHHNWHDFAFRYDDLFDFSLAGEEDLIEASGRPFPLIPYDACNFAPECFAPGNTEKFWDVLYVARAVFFKCIPEFFDCIKALYSRGERLRVLFICPVPPNASGSKNETVLDVRRLYESNFSREEQDLFTLLATEHRYPFPFDLDTLAFFYRSSRVFVHFASDERRCRVASYAWASGMPVVAMAPVASLLPQPLRRPPYFFEAKAFADFPDVIVRAREASVDPPDGAAQACFRAARSVAKLDGALGALAKVRGLPYEEGQLLSTGLDIRLGRHHMQVASGNTLGMQLVDFLRYLGDRPVEDLVAPLRARDPERAIAAQVAPSSGTVSDGDVTFWSRLRRRF
jgi:hypothetical protein